MEDNAEILNYEFNYNVYLIEHMINKNFKSQNERRKILAWLGKLKQCNMNAEEMNIRNDFIYYLWTCVKNAELRPPFDAMPPYEQIAKIKNLLPTGQERTDVNTDWVEDLENADSGIPEIYKKSPDGGAFLSSQPIPKCGAFCYLAIVSKPTDETEK